MVDLTTKKPSELIRLAVADLVKCEKNLGYKIHMGHYHFNDEDGICNICLAGAVMAQSLKCPISITRSPSYYNVQKILYALDCFRCGTVDISFCYMGIDTKNFYNREITQYRVDKNKFKEEILALAYDLEKDGL